MQLKESETEVNKVEVNKGIRIGCKELFDDSQKNKTKI
jgi:hypothetical protein